MKPHDGIPGGAIRLDAYLYRGQIVVCGEPNDAHNCDDMGCGRDHVIARVGVSATVVRDLSAEAQRRTPAKASAPRANYFCHRCHELHPSGYVCMGVR